MKKLYMLFIALFPVFAWGQILSWNFTGAAGNEASITVTAKDANLNTSSITRGSGLATERYSVRGFDELNLGVASGGAWVSRSSVRRLRTSFPL